MACWSLIDFEVGKTKLDEIVDMTVSWGSQQVSDKVKDLMMTDFIVATSRGEDVGLFDFDRVLHGVQRTKAALNLTSRREQETHNLIRACHYLEDVISRWDTVDVWGLVDTQTMVLDLHQILMDKLD